MPYTHPPISRPTLHGHPLVQALVAAEIDHFFAAGAGSRTQGGPNRVLCLDPHRAKDKAPAALPLLPATGWFVARRVLGWEHGLKSEPGRVRFVEQLATLHSRYDDLDTVHAMLSLAARLRWRSVCLLGSAGFMQRARLAAMALGLQVEQALAPA